MFRIKVSSAVALCMTGLLLAVFPCHAAEKNVSLGIAGSVSTSPYKGYDTQWMPVPLISYESEYFYIRNVTAGVKLFTRDYIEVSVFAGYDPTSFDPDDSSDRKVRRLKSRWSSAVVGADMRVMTPYGDVYANLAGDVLGHSGGFTGSFGYSNSIEPGPLELTLDVGTYWASSDYNDYYYGVSRKEANKSGLDAYDAGAGFSPYLGLTVSATFAESWTVFCKGEITSLSSTVKDSPMVDESFTQNMTFGVAYSF